jgi:hypothetical protein
MMRQNTPAAFDPIESIARGVLIAYHVGYC